MKNLWQKERKQVYRELLRQYLNDGYERKDAKKFASEEAAEYLEHENNFINDLLDTEEENKS